MIFSQNDLILIRELLDHKVQHAYRNFKHLGAKETEYYKIIRNIDLFLIVL